MCIRDRSIAKEIELEDPFEKIGAELVKEVAKKTDDVAGDGTTTATVIAQAMVREGLRNVAAGANPMALKQMCIRDRPSTVPRLAAGWLPEATTTRCWRPARPVRRVLILGGCVGRARAPTRRW